MSFAYETIDGFDKLHGTANVKVAFLPDAKPSQAKLDRIGARREARKEWNRNKGKLTLGLDTTEDTFALLADELSLHPLKQAA